MCRHAPLFSSRILRAQSASSWPMRVVSFPTQCAGRRKTVSVASFNRWTICIIYQTVGKQSEQQCKIKVRQDEPPVCLAGRSRSSSFLRNNFTRLLLFATLVCLECLVHSFSSFQLLFCAVRLDRCRLPGRSTRVTRR